MRPTLSRTLAALTVAATLALAIAPSTLAAEWPVRVVAYQPHGTFTADTNLLTTSGYAAWAIDEFLRANTPLPALGASFLAAERTEGINARYLVAQVLHETDWGTSWIARAKHNLFGYNAYDKAPGRLATWFPTFESGIRAATRFIRGFYLDPNGRWWGGFPTLRAMNLLYASDPGWADEIAATANRIDPLIPTLHGLGISFGTPQVFDDVIAGGTSRVVVPVASASGRPLPSAIRFAIRWSPEAVVEDAPVAPAIPSADWMPAQRSDGPAGVALAVATPAAPGLYRLEIAARDADGAPLPHADDPPVPSLAIRVYSPTDAVVTIGTTGTSPIVSVRPAGAATIPPTWVDVTGIVQQTSLRVVALPLDPAIPASPMADVALRGDLTPGSSLVVPLAPVAGPAILVARLFGDPFSFGRSVPALALVDGPAGATRLTPLAAADPRSDALLRSAGRPDPAGRAVASASAAREGPLSVNLTSRPGSVVVQLAGNEAVVPKPGTTAPSPAAAPEPGAAAAALAATAGQGAAPAPTAVPQDAAAGSPAEVVLWTIDAAELDDLTLSVASVGDAPATAPATTAGAPAGVGPAGAGWPLATSTASAAAPATSAAPARSAAPAPAPVGNGTSPGAHGSPPPDATRLADPGVAGSPGPGSVTLDALPAGVRLAIAGRIRADGQEIDAGSLWIGWIAVAPG